MQETQRNIKKIFPNGETQEETPTLRIAAYCRVSTGSRDQEESFASQMKHYAEAVGRITNSQLTDIYADEAISGRGTAKREDFKRLMDDCKKGKIDRILTKSVSRFARNTVDCLQTVRTLSALGVSILFEKEQIDTAKMPTEVLLAMIGTQAQDESISHGKNMRWSYEQRMKKGEYLGTRPAYGYELIDCGTATIKEDEAKNVRLIADLYTSGWGKLKIAKYLNERQIARENGKQWDTFTVNYILNNERYIGNALLQKTFMTEEYPPRKLRNDGTKAQYYVENCLPAILTMEQWDAIQRLQEQRRPEIGKRGGHALSKMLRCSECGGAYRRIQRKNGMAWACTYRVSGRSNCALHAVLEDDVCQALLHTVNKLCRHREELLPPLIGRLETLQSKVNGTDMKLYKIDQEIAVLSKQCLVLADLLSDGILESADFASRNQELAEQIAKLRSKRRDCLRLNETDNQISNLQDLDEILADMSGELDDYDEGLIRTVVDHITVLSATELQIHLHGGLTVKETLPDYHTGRRKQA